MYFSLPIPRKCFPRKGTLVGMFVLFKTKVCLVKIQMPDENPYLAKKQKHLLCPLSYPNTWQYQPGKFYSL
jgi:hypothetical protein